MADCRIIDTFPAFLDFWPVIQQEPLDAQVDAWASVHMARWPELLEKQQADYTSHGEDWRRIARERVFPYLGQRLPALSEARRHLRAACKPVHAAAEEMLGVEIDIVFVIHVGIGCGAGWVTTYQDSPAVLFGLENCAEEGWTQPSVLRGLVAHELGHQAHFHWRAQSALPRGSGPWWQLYTEGFAQRCEHRIQGHDTWHMAYATDGWLDWCQAHRAWLAAEFLRLVDRGEPVRPFFGSWFELRGWKQTGYFLGHEVIRRLEMNHDLEDIARLDDIGTTVRHELEELARTGG